MICPECEGRGYFPLSKERIIACPRYTAIDCYKCNGTGRVGPITLMLGRSYERIYRWLL